jgi:L-malate glycosyltransferase
MKVRVLLVGPSLGILGGQAVQAARLLTSLRECDVLEVDFLAVNPSLPAPLSALQRIKYVRTIVTSFAYLWSLLRTVPRYDVIHAFSASYFSYLLAPMPAMAVAKLFRKQTILNYRSGEAADHLASWKRTAVPTMRLMTDAIAVPSGYLVDVFASFGLDAISIANFVPIDRLRYRRRDNPRPVFFANRNHEELYNVGCVLRAFEIIQREVPEAELIVAGDGSQRAILESLAGALQLRNVQFIGRITPEEMATKYDEADVYLNSPDIDNMPGSIIEAFACGLPVVTTNAGGIPWIVSDEKNGLMVERNDHVGMARASLRLLKEPGLAARLSAAARSECEERYVWPAVRKQWEALYLKLAARESE